MRRALILALLAASPALAQEELQMSPGAREAFRAEVRAYLLDNPEVILEAMDVLESRQAEAQAAADSERVAQAEVVRETDWIGGNPEGDMTVVEFLDYRCGYCRRAQAEVEALIAGDEGLRFVIKEFPILGDASTVASRFALAVRQLHGDDAYIAAHDALMALQSDPTPDVLADLAGALGYEAEPILAAMDSADVTEVIDANHALGEELAITGTPTFVIGDRMVRGYVPLAQLQAIVADERDG